MRTVEDILRDMGELTDIDRDCIAQGFSCGNFASAYETTDYEIVAKSLVGTNGFYRVAHLLGFFSSFEAHEIPEEYREEVVLHREAFKRLGVL